MAKECLKEKHKKLSQRWEQLNAEERKLMELPKEKREEALAEFKARRIKNRDFKTRQYNRCTITGRSKGVFRYFGICRQSLREMAHKGLLPGVKKSSW